MAMVQEQQQYYQPQVVVVSQQEPRPMPGARIFLIVYNAYVLLNSVGGLGVGIMFFTVFSNQEVHVFHIWGSLVITASLSFVAHSTVGLIGAIQSNACLLLAAFIVGIVVVLFEFGVAVWAFIGIRNEVVGMMLRAIAGFFILDAIIRVIAVVFTWLLRSAILNTKPPVVVGQPMMVGGQSPQHIVLVQPPPQVVVESQPHQAPPPLPTPMKGPAPIHH